MSNWTRTEVGALGVGAERVRATDALVHLALVDVYTAVLWLLTGLRCVARQTGT